MAEKNFDVLDVPIDKWQKAHKKIVDIFRNEPDKRLAAGEARKLKEKYQHHWVQQGFVRSRAAHADSGEGSTKKVKATKTKKSKKSNKSKKSKTKKATHITEPSPTAVILPKKRSQKNRRTLLSRERQQRRQNARWAACPCAAMKNGSSTHKLHERSGERGTYPS
jgi:hypothetical protein